MSWVVYVFLGFLGIGLLVGPLIDRFISWYTGKPIPDADTPLEMLFRWVKRK